MASVAAVAGVGAIVLIGPVVAAGIVAGLVGAMSGWGVHKQHIADYQEMLKEGKALVIFHGDPHQVARAESCLLGTNPVVVHLHADNSSDAPDIGP